jgi:hypothetical protein
MPSERSRAFGPAILCLLTLIQTADADALPEYIVFQPRLAPDVAAMPRVLQTGAAAEKINERLDLMDRSEASAMAECADGPHRFWERWIDIAFATSGFLGVVSHTGFYCSGAAHPETYSRAVTFDLATGEPVDWREVFPASLRNSEDFSFPTDILRGSLELTDIYVAQNRTSGAECRDTVAGRPHDFLVYPRDNPVGLVLTPVDLAYAEKACADPVVIPLTVLRSMGLTHPILDAMSVE